MSIVWDIVHMNSYFSIIWIHISMSYEFIFPTYHMNSYFQNIWIHISDRSHLSSFKKQTITPEKWSREKSLKTDMKYIEKFWSHPCNIVVKFWRIIVKIPYHPIIFRTLDTTVIFHFIKVLVANVQALFKNWILNFQLLSERRRLQCSFILIIKHGYTSIAPSCHF